MKRLFILLGLIGVIHVSAGFNSSANLLRTKKEINDTYSVGLLTPITPSFTQLNGNLFLAIKTASPIEVEDGDVVEFIFGRKTSLISFHVNESNQEIINTGNASLFVMVHNDLAIALKKHRLKHINVRHNSELYSYEVNKFWAPDQYMTSL
jgi:hypothetical protein